MCFFFFQAEDGIRDYKVTGVQTCALPIYPTLFTLSYLNYFTFFFDFDQQTYIVFSCTQVGANSASDKPIIWVDSAIHAREWLTVGTTVWIINYVSRVRRIV